MSLISMALLGVMVISLAIGQLMFKHVGTQLAASGFTSITFSPVLWGALVLYALSTIVWIIVLSREPISRAYPVTALTYLVVPVMGAFLFGEKLPPQLLLGLAIMIIGLGLVVTTGTGRN